MWHSEMYDNNACLNYRIFTNEKKLKEYFDILPRSLWFTLVKFRCGNIKIPVVAGRYNAVPRDERLCQLCNTNSIGDEFHYLFECNHFTE